MAPMVRLLHRVLSIGTTTIAFTTVTFVAYTLAFGLVRTVALPLLFRIPLVSHILRPFLAHFVRGRWGLLLLWRYRGLAWHNFLLGLTTIGAWEFAENLFDEKVQEVRVLFHMARSFLRITSIAFGCCISHC
jgi:nucleoporin NDC1